MANVVTNTRIVCTSQQVIQYITIASDGTEETDLVIYDSSVVATALGKTDPLMCSIMGVQYVCSSATGFFNLEFDASTDVSAFSLAANNSQIFDFEPIGGLRNTAGSGITGDIMLTTTGLAPGDSFVIILTVRPY